MTLGGLRVTATVALCVLRGGNALAGFDWGGDCDAGQGQFEQHVAHGTVVTVGTIPPLKRNVRIALSSSADVDVQLINRQSSHSIIAWPYGDLNGPAAACAVFRDVEYCYSGYNGVDAERGSEWIEVRGDTNRELTMRAYGFESGIARVSYSWEAVPTCNETGSGQFYQYVPREGVAVVGDIPAGKTNVVIRLNAEDDLDVQLFDGCVAVVRWPDGHLSGAGEQAMVYGHVTVRWSGYNGDGTGLGNEYIQLGGTTTCVLTMKAYGYRAGNALVRYAWGVGVGERCSGSGAGGCVEGLACKERGAGASASTVGVCHTADWCLSQTTVSVDCAGLPTDGLPPGHWTCQRFQCKWVEPICTNDDPRVHYVAADAVCDTLRYTCESGQAYYRDACGCGCMDLICSASLPQCPIGYACDWTDIEAGGVAARATAVCRRECNRFIETLVCDSADYCVYPAGHCGAGSQPGMCRPRPLLCTQEYDPVCGCDGTTFANGCRAAVSGVSVAHDGQCVTDCVVTGCHGQLCASQHLLTSCEWRPSYACLQHTSCGPYGPNATCGWEQNEKFLDCMAEGSD